jgi:hypothetical protein
MNARPPEMSRRFLSERHVTLVTSGRSPSNHLNPLTFRRPGGKLDVVKCWTLFVSPRNRTQEADGSIPFSSTISLVFLRRMALR